MGLAPHFLQVFFFVLSQAPMLEEATERLGYRTLRVAARVMFRLSGAGKSVF